MIYDMYVTYCTGHAHKTQYIILLRFSGWLSVLILHMRTMKQSHALLVGARSRVYVCVCVCMATYHMSMRSRPATIIK